MSNADIDFDAYGRAVLAGEVTVCKWTRLAVERHYRDMDTAADRGLVFSEPHARHALQFFDFLRHSKDRWAGQAFQLSPWQAFWHAVLFGWLRADGTRRFRKGYMRVARKNGKTTTMAGTGLYLLVGDGIAGAEVYTAATKLDQAKLAHKEAEMMVLQSPALRRALEVYKNKIFIPGTASLYAPLGADAKTQDGLNPHGALVDELHAHPNSALWDVLDSAMGARSQPLMLAITTAGFNGEESVCVVQDNYLKGILEQQFDDDAYWGVIYEIDDEDDWRNEACWIKANPNLGVSVSLDSLREAARTAENQPSSLENFLTKRLNRWVKAQNLWLPMEHWRACRSVYALDDLRDAETICGGLDLASTSDLCSFVLAARMPDGKRRLWGRHYLPEDAALANGNINKHLYQQWARSGWLTLTPGNVADYDWIKRDILQALDTLDIREIGFDNWNSTQLVNDLLAESAPMVVFRQGFVSMNPAMKEVERLILKRDMEHPGDPVLTWAMGNVVASRDPAGNVKPDKAKSTNKIDPAVASIMALGRLMVHADDGGGFGIEVL